ncbi:MAG: hypothetical protein M0Z83_07215 [Betaproteobacteria bacterium]|nr:hypothetical protein [Betaproteobacteria bacterium]
MSHTNNDIEVALLRELYSNYPPILQIKSVAEILREDIPTIRARIRRGSFQVAVRQDPGGRQYVLLADLVRFFVSGEIQTQPAMRAVRSPRNPCGINGTRPRGRPTKTEQLLKQQNCGG